MMVNVFDVTEFGAIGDGKTDSTKAIQAAIDEAGKVRGTVLIPPGIYMCGQLWVKHSGICIKGFQGWGYRDEGGSILKLNDKDADCLLNLTYSHGSKIDGLQLLGNNLLGNNVHGIMLNYPKCNGDPIDPEENKKARTPLFYDCHRTFNEDSIRIENCQCRYFSGDGIHLNHMFAFKISNCMIIENAGNGIFVNGWDGWIHDNIIAINGKAGIGSVRSDKNGWGAFAAVSIVNNRIEWNRYCGIHTVVADTLNINNNLFDRCIGPAIKLGEISNTNITITGNIFRRNGAAMVEEDGVTVIPFEDANDNSHLYIMNGKNITITGNAFSAGGDDTDGKRPWSPDYSIVYKDIESCVISGNVLEHGALIENIVNRGGHVEECIVQDNVGRRKCV